MFNYMDKTFCSDKDCVNDKCYRFLSKDNLENAKKHNMPICYADFALNCDKKIISKGW